MKNLDRPIKPSEIRQGKRESIPKEVFNVVNELISEKWSRNSATIKQKDIVSRAAEALNIRPGEFNFDFLNFEELYREEGFVVNYDKPGYNETYDAFFTFSLNK